MTSSSENLQNSSSSSADADRIQQLAAERESISALRDTLGNEVVDSAIAKVDVELDRLVPVLTDEQTKLLDSWNTLESKMQGLGLEVPAPTPEVEVVMAAAQLRKILTNPQTSPAPSAKPAEPKKATSTSSKPAKTTPKAAKSRKTTKKEPGVTKITEEELQKSEPNKSDDEILQDQSRLIEMKFNPSVKDSVVRILRELEQLRGQETSITELFRSITGSTRMRIKLLQKQLDSGEQVDVPVNEINEMAKFAKQFEHLMKRMIKSGAIEVVGRTKNHHVTPKMQSKVITTRGPIRFEETDEGVSIEIGSRAYHAKANLAARTIDNGRNRVEVFGKASPENFEKVIGVLALLTIDNETETFDKEYKSRELFEWAIDANQRPLERRKTKQERFTHLLKNIIREFDGEFPLTYNGGHARGARYIWRAGSTFEIEEDHTAQTTDSQETSPVLGDDADPKKKDSETVDTDTTEALELEEPAENGSATTPEEDSQVPPRKTAKEVIDGMLGLDPKRMAEVYLRFVNIGRFKYPDSLEEATFLLNLVLDSQSNAEARESDRFCHAEYRAFQNFQAAAISACFNRISTWGDFTEITKLLQRRIRQESAPNKEALKILDGYKRKVIDMRDKLGKISKEAKLDENLVLETLLEGQLPEVKGQLNAILVFDVFRANRDAIISQLGAQGYKTLNARLHKKVAASLGYDSYDIAISDRTPKYVEQSGATQTSTGENPNLTRTDVNRFIGRR